MSFLRVLLGLVVGLTSIVAGGLAQPATQERPSWRAIFEKHQAVGTLVVADERGAAGPLLVYNPLRASQQFLPASTYKIPHSLFALDAGAVRDEFQVFPWDGVNHEFPGHNQNQTLRSAMRYSAVWVFELFAKQIGKQKAREYLRKAQYGNADPSGAEPYWLEGSLRISPLEQIAFLRRLYRNRLPFKLEHQLLVKDTMINEAGREWILRAKTGWTGKQGWWVGWVEWPNGPVFFALHIDTPKRGEDLPKREAITREILRELKAIP